MLRQAQRLAAVRPLPRRAADGWGLPLDAARELINARTGLVMITEPHNPSGVSAPREQVLELADLAAAAGAKLLVNEIYRGYTDAPSYHLAAENIVVVSSLSKLLGAYGARLGWISTAPQQARRLRQAHFNMGMPTQPGALAGLAFLQRADELRAAALRLARAGVEVVDAWVSATPGVGWRRPGGAGFGCLELPSGTDDLQLAERLHDRHGVLVIPGCWFQAPGTLRISWLQADDRLAAGLDLIARALA
jgi:aspartate/methionine/tyrosine aminotransferase